MTLETFTFQTFEGRLGEPFSVRVEGAEPFAMHVQQVRQIPTSGWRPGEDTDRRKPFTLHLLGPASFVLPQKIYRFKHPELGDFDMFIVPIGRSAAGVTYEAVFS